MKRNLAGQIAGAQMIATAGGAFTGAVTVYVTADNGAQTLGSVGSGIAAHKGNGLHNYVPAQAETDYGYIQFTFVGTGAIPQTIPYTTVFDANIVTSKDETVSNYDGIAQGGGTSYIILQDSTDPGDNYFRGQNCELVGGTGDRQNRLIASSSWNGSQVICIPTDDWVTPPDDTTRYAFSAGAADLQAVKGSPDGVAAFGQAIKTIGEGTVGSGSSTTVIVTSSVNPAAGTVDCWNGKIILFLGDTVTAGLQNQGSPITANTSGATPSITVTSLTTIPVPGDKFVIQ